MPSISIDYAVLELSPSDTADLDLREGDAVRVTSRRGSIAVPLHIQPNLRPGLAFMAIHFPEEADVNQLTIDAWDPKSGTAEFKATAVRVEPVPQAEGAVSSTSA